MASRTFGNNDIKALSSRIRLAQETGANGIRKVESARSDIESAIAEAIRPEWMRVLRTIPVDELGERFYEALGCDKEHFWPYKDTLTALGGLDDVAEEIGLDRP